MYVPYYFHVSNVSDDSGVTARLHTLTHAQGFPHFFPLLHKISAAAPLVCAQGCKKKDRRSFQGHKLVDVAA